jgi:hypothetical protein
LLGDGAGSFFEFLFELMFFEEYFVLFDFFLEIAFTGEFCIAVSFVEFFGFHAFV